MRLVRFAPNAVMVEAGCHKFYFSYETLIAYSGSSEDIRIQPPSKTTAKHMNEFGISDFEVVTEEYFNKRIARMYDIAD